MVEQRGITEMNDPMGTSQAEQTLNYINVKKVFDRYVY